MLDKNVLQFIHYVTRSAVNSVFEVYLRVKISEPRTFNIELIICVILPWLLSCNAV